MNIFIHGGVGVIGIPFLGVPFFIGSLVPDLVLIWNEYSLRRKRKVFDPLDVSQVEIYLYYLTHCLLFVAVSWFLLGSSFSLGIFCHQVLDWFSHSGRFSTRPFFPFYFGSVEDFEWKKL